MRAKGRIAQACLDALPLQRLGSIVLRESQRFMVARAARALRRNGGCLIAEDVGRGKTYIALALAREFESFLVVAPASLRTTWLRAMAAAETQGAIVSHEALSRVGDRAAHHDLVIVDESHHYRNPATRRYQALARLTATAPVILLSATPFQNRRTDLAAQIALFHGESAYDLQDAQLARFALRSSAQEDDLLPSAARPEWIASSADDGKLLDAILALPSPPRPVDGGDAGALRTLALVRAWTSSRAALVGTLRTRRKVATAIEQCIDQRRTPTRTELRAWSHVGADIQLGFAALLSDASVLAERTNMVQAQLTAEYAALDLLGGMLAGTDDPDIERADVLRSLRAQNPGERILVFSEFAQTIERMFALLRATPAVGMATASGCRIATGRIPRSELLRLFSPRAQGAPIPAVHNEVTLLLTTDLLSEGVNLQDASIVIHLDLPWNPARLTQRIGRIRRPGGSDVVRSYLFSPPANARQLVRAEGLLRRKIREAEAALGRGLEVLPCLGTATDTDLTGESRATNGIAELDGLLVARLRNWQVEDDHLHATPEVAVAQGSCPEWIAALDDGTLVGARDGVVSEYPELLLRILDNVNDAAQCNGDATIALSELTVYLEQQHFRTVCGARSQPGPIQRRIMSFLRILQARTPRHQQSTMLRAASMLRQFASRPAPIGLQAGVAALLDQQGRVPDVLDRACGLVSRKQVPPSETRTCVAFIALVTASQGA